MADLRLAGADRGFAERAFDVVLSAFVRGKVHTYRGAEDEAVAALERAGFEEASLHRGERIRRQRRSARIQALLRSASSRRLSDEREGVEPLRPGSERVSGAS